MAQQIRDYSGLWRCAHWYPSNKFVGDQMDEHEMKGYWDGDTLVLESLPNDKKSYMLVRLTIADDVATGNWHETTIPSSEYKGATYTGSGQLIINPETFFMEGKWAGAGFDSKLKKLRIYTGNWEIAPVRKD